MYLKFLCNVFCFIFVVMLCYVKWQYSLRLPILDLNPDGMEEDANTMTFLFQNAVQNIFEIQGLIL